ncbi:hypothetical protein [Cypionkella sp. TWP1-2-1b2]|uniref:hypothetical protein n=1 Tax=Cypionkella sp. TWP1-2-1b2 TaxID=2804675 RepID=UPI003CFA8F70
MGNFEMTEGELQFIVCQIRASGVADPCQLFAPVPPAARKKRGESKAEIDTTPRMDKPFRIFVPTGQQISSNDYIDLIYATKPTLARPLGLGDMP